jgi:hypothetical protein
MREIIVFGLICTIAVAVLGVSGCTIPSACPICGSNDATLKGESVDGYHYIYQCNKCNATFEMRKFYR